MAVFEYLGRYTHRVAISNSRIVHTDEKTVTFLWKDYRYGNRKKRMTLATKEFMRRFLLHVLPKGFKRIRFYGISSNRYRKAMTARVKKLLLRNDGNASESLLSGPDTLVLLSPDDNTYICSRCKSRDVRIEEIPPCYERKWYPNTS